MEVKKGRGTNPKYRKIKKGYKEMKVGQIFYSHRKDSEWKIWHEIMNIQGNIVTLANYGKDLQSEEVTFTKAEIKYCLRKHILIPA